MIVSYAITLLLGLIFWLYPKARGKSQLELVDDPVRPEEKDGTEDDLKPLPNFDIYTTKPRPYRPWAPGRFTMTMGIRKMPKDDWILLDNQYIKEQEFRRQLLKEKREAVLQHLPGSEAACEETLDMIVGYLTKRYPQYFVFDRKKSGYLHNRITGLTFKVHKPFEVHPLEVAAQLVMEDLNLLMLGDGEEAEQHYLCASFTMAPAGWHLEERIGWPLWKIHGPVPLWDEKLRKSVKRNFLNMRVDSPIQRHNYFLQVTQTVFQQDPFPENVDFDVTAKDIIIRHERQTLRRLPRTRAILFTVRSYFTPLTDLADEPDNLRDLISAVEHLPENMARYKTRGLWYKPLKEWAATVLEEKFDDERIDAKEIYS